MCIYENFSRWLYLKEQLLNYIICTFSTLLDIASQIAIQSSFAKLHSDQQCGEYLLFLLTATNPYFQNKLCKSDICKMLLLINFNLDFLITSELECVFLQLMTIWLVLSSVNSSCNSIRVCVFQFVSVCICVIIPLLALTNIFLSFYIFLVLYIKCVPYKWQFIQSGNRYFNMLLWVILYYSLIHTYKSSQWSQGQSYFRKLTYNYDFHFRFSIRP